MSRLSGCRADENGGRFRRFTSTGTLEGAQMVEGLTTSAKSAGRSKPGAQSDDERYQRRASITSCTFDPCWSTMATRFSAVKYW